MDVNGLIKIGNNQSQCSSNIEGCLRYNSNLKNIEFCNGSNWLLLNVNNNSPSICYVTWSQHDKAPNIVLSNNNLTIKSSESWQSCRATLGKSSGRWYFEVLADVGPNGFNFVGVGKNTAPLDSIFCEGDGGWGYYGSMGDLRANNVNHDQKGELFRDGKYIIGVAVDLDNGNIWWSLNGDWQLNGDPSTNINPTFSNLNGTVYPMSAVALDNSTSTLYCCEIDFHNNLPDGFQPWSE